MHLLIQRLELRDRKSLAATAGIRADLWNINCDHAKHPEPFTASDFLPELPEDRRNRLADEKAAAEYVPTEAELDAFKASFMATKVGGTKVPLAR